MSDEIRVSNATKVIKGRTVLDGVSLDLSRGGVYGFLGINGSGKTMLFRAIAGLIHLTTGSVEVFGKTIGHNHDVGTGKRISTRIEGQRLVPGGPHGIG